MTESQRAAESKPSTDSVALRPFVPRLVTSGALPAAPSVLHLEGTLMSADLSGFTKLSEKLASHGREGAEELTDLLNECFTGMIGHVDALGGDVLKFGGDALLVLFTGAEHARRACHAAVGMREVIRRPLKTRTGQVHLRISQGLHSGLFDVYLLRTSHIELVVTGSSATETVRCEAIAEAGQILMSPQTAAYLAPGDVKPGPEGRFLLARPPRVPVIDLTTRVENLVGDPGPFIPASQRDQILAGATNEHRSVAVAFIKFSHTDELGEHEGSEALLQRLQRMAEVVDETSREIGIHWLATDVAPDGGKFILAGGAPVAYGDDEDRLVRAVRLILDRVVELDVRAGVNCGPVFAGNLGGPTRRACTIMGDAVNLTARLMQAASDRDELASQAIVKRCRTRFMQADVEPFYVKGKSAPVHATRVLGIDHVSAALTPTGSLPLVGRAEELEQLRQACRDAVGGNGRFVEIVGEPGTGKTRLLDELLAESSDLRRLRVECGQYARQSPYFVIRLLLRSIAGIPLDAGRDEAGRALTVLVERLAPQRLPMLPLIAIPFDAAVPSTEEADEIAPEFWRDVIVPAIAQIVGHLLSSPTLIVVEDAHWVDESSREILERLASDVEQGPWVLLVTRRPGESPMAPNGLLHPVRIELGPLGSEASVELGIVAGGDASRLPPGEWEDIAARSGGNPLFVIELAAAAVTSGSAEAVTNSVESLITTRIDALAPADRLLLREAAVLGLVIDLDLYAKVIGDRSVRSLRRWEPLGSFVAIERNRLVRFRNVLYRDVAYEGLSYRRRREMHRRLGEALDALDHPPAALCSLHFESAGDFAKAWNYSVKGGREARRDYANAEAAGLFRRALRCARYVSGLDAHEVADVAEELGDVADLAARLDEATAALKRARAIWRDDPSRHASLLRKEGKVSEIKAQYGSAIRKYQRGLALLAGSSNPDDLGVMAELEWAIALVRHRQGRYRDTVMWGERAVGHAERSGNRVALAHAHRLIQAGLDSLGQARDSSHIERAVELFREVGDLVGEAKALVNVGVNAYMSGDWSKARQYYDQCRVVANRAGDVIRLALVELNSGELLSAQGHLVDADVALTRAATLFRSSRDPLGEAYAWMYRGITVARAGRTDDGLAELDAALAQLLGLGASGAIPTARLHRAEALLLGGRHEDAIAECEVVLAAKGRLELSLEALARRIIGLAYLGQSAKIDAERSLRLALERATEAGAHEQIGRALRDLAPVVATRDPAEAAELNLRADTILRALGVVEDPSQGAHGSEPTAS